MSRNYRFQNPEELYIGYLLPYERIHTVAGAAI